MSILATDTFTDTSTTLLTAHTADTGQSWIKSADSDGGADIQINSNRAVCATTPFAERAVLAADPATADYTVEAEFSNVSTSTDNYASIWVRALSAALTGYQVYWAVTFDILTLRRNVAGVATDLASGALVGTTPSAVIKVVVTGAVIDVYVDAVLLFTYTDATPIVAAGRAGIGFFTAGTGNAQRIDSFQITETTVAATGGGAVAYYKMMRAMDD